MTITIKYFVVNIQKKKNPTQAFALFHRVFKTLETSVVS